MSESELLKEFESFLCERGDWTKFIERMHEKGYDEAEIDAVLEDLDE